MTSQGNELKTFKVLPNVIDDFQPSVQLKVTYGSSELTNGVALRPEGTQEPPKVSFLSKPILTENVIRQPASRMLLAQLEGQKKILRCGVWVLLFFTSQ